MMSGKDKLYCHKMCLPYPSSGAADLDTLIIIQLLHQLKIWGKLNRKFI
jgi:hypothetical protein